MQVIYRYNSLKVIVENGLVIYSDFRFCVIGKKPDLKALKACAWKKDKKPVIYYANGTTNPRRYV